MKAERPGCQVRLSGMHDLNGWPTGSLFGDKVDYNGDWLKRAAAAKAGLYGNDAVGACTR